jgi:hypothetical protein
MVRSGTTTIITDSASKDKIQARIAQIKKEMAETDSVVVKLTKLVIDGEFVDAASG